MLWIYISIGVLGLVIGSGFYLLTKKKAATVILIGIVVALALVATNKYIMPRYNAASYESRIIKENPLLALLAEKSPEDFQAYIAKVKKNILEKGDKSNEIYYVSELLYNSVIKFGPTATNASLYHFLQANLVLDKKLLSIDPELVLVMEFPDKFKGKTDPNMLGVIAETQNLLNAKAAVIASSIDNPQTPLTDEQQKQSLEMIRSIVADLSTKYGAQTLTTALQHPDDPSISPKVAAEIIIAFYEAIMAKGEDSAGMMVKVMLIHSPLRK